MLLQPIPGRRVTPHLRLGVRQRRYEPTLGVVHGEPHPPTRTLQQPLMDKLFNHMEKCVALDSLAQT